MRVKLGWPAVAVAGAALLGPAAGLVPAQAATPGWRVVQVYGDTPLDSVAATSASSAVVAGVHCTNPCGTQSLVVKQWNGSAWQPVAPPPGFGKDVNSAVTAASSATDEWVFANATTANGITYYSVPLHWNGTAWAASPRITGLATTAAVAPGLGDAWLFGLIISPPAGYVAHFDGTAWTRVKLPIVAAAASGSSASDIWAVGSGSLTAPGQTTMHWNGSTWAKVPLPPVSLPSGEAYQLVGVTDIAPRNVWADGVVTKGMGLAPGNVLLHWDGTAWTRVKVPVALSEPGPITADGHGGIWLVGFKGTAATASFFHESGGHWSVTPVPSTSGHVTQLMSLAAIPGTRSVWAVGSVLPTGGGPGLGQGGILKFGP